MLIRVKQTIEQHQMLNPGDKVVLGVSGGADSIGLLHILLELTEYNLHPIVAHLNHGIRGEEAQRDAAFVEGVCKTLCLPFELKTVDTLSFKEGYKLSLEEAARVLRYNFFYELMDKHKAQKIATAHTLDDQAETVLIRLLRGSGPRGLSAINPVVNKTIIRPLIDTRRSEITDYLSTRDIQWVEDSTNEDTSILRNRIRKELVPVLESYNPRIKEGLCRLALLSGYDYDYLESEATKLFPSVWTVRESGLEGELRRYSELPPALRLALLRKGMENYKGDLRNISASQILSADELLLSDTPSGTSEFAEGITIEKGYDRFLLSSKNALGGEFTHIIDGVGHWEFPNLSVEIIKHSDPSVISEDLYTADFDSALVNFPLTVRNLREGDRFVPLGMSGTKKLQDYFVDSKIPRYKRARIPIFQSGGDIIWIGGHRMDDRYKVSPDTKEVLRIQIKKTGEFD